MKTTTNINTPATHIIDRTPALRAYLRDIEHTPTCNLSPRDRLIVDNYRLVISLAADYQHRGLPMEDLVGYGNIGLAEAADHFDPTLGVDFAPYACRWIRKEICQGLSDAGHPIRLPRQQRHLLQRIQREQNTFMLRNGREATTDELADIVGSDAHTVCILLSATERFESLDEEPGNDDADEHDLQRIDQLLRHLNPQQREVLLRHFYNGETAREIAHTMQLSRARINQLIGEAKALMA